MSGQDEQVQRKASGWDSLEVLAQCMVKSDIAASDTAASDIAGLWAEQDCRGGQYAGIGAD